MFQDDDGPKGPWEQLVPDELNDLLRERVPGPNNRNFRLDVRKAYVSLVHDGVELVTIPIHGEQQQRVLDELNKMVEAKLHLNKAGMDGWPGLERAKGR